MSKEDPSRTVLSFTVNYKGFPSGGPPCPSCGESSLSYCPGCSKYTCVNQGCKSYGKQFTSNQVTLQTEKKPEVQQKLDQDFHGAENV